MMFRRNNGMRAGALRAALCLLAGLGAGSAYAEMGYAVVPRQIIYPGQEIDAAQLQEVEVTNRNLAGGYASAIDQVIGKVSNRTFFQGAPSRSARCESPMRSSAARPFG